MNMKRIQIGDKVESDYGRGLVVAVTNEWIIHSNSENGTNSEFAILKSDDQLILISEKEFQSLNA